MNRWTKGILEKIDNYDFAIAIMNERQNKLTNPYSLLSQKINSAKAELMKAKERTQCDAQKQAQPEPAYLAGGIRKITASDFCLEHNSMEWECDEGMFSYILSSKSNVDEIFGTNVETDENDDYIDIYAFISPDHQDMREDLYISLWKGNGDIEEFAYKTTEDERRVLLSLILRHYQVILSKLENKLTQKGEEVSEYQKI